MSTIDGEKSETSRRTFLKGTMGSAAASLAAPAVIGAGGQARDRPNIVYILADDLGYGDPGCYGQKQIQTPNMDRLAKEGMRFTQHYAASPVCAPSRCGFMTGKHMGHATRRSNRPYVPLSKNDVTVGEILKKAGYRTGVVGKWGLADTQKTFETGTAGKPNQRGFDYWFGFLNQKHAWNYYPDYLWENEKRVDLLGSRYAHDVFTEKTLHFIRRNQDGPFCILAWYTTPHVNNAFGHTVDNLPVPSLGQYADADWPLIEKKYAAMVSRLDRDVGRILGLLEELGIAENTAVMFSSDNGAQSYEPHSKEFFDSTAGLRSYKGRLYEGGIRVPLVVRWPGAVKAGTVSHHLSAFWDVLPTMADLAGVQPPAGIDGLSFGPTLRGGQQPEHDYLYWEFPGHGYQQAARQGDWKAIRRRAGQPIELYNLEADRREQNNLADDRTGKVREFAELFRSAHGKSEHWPLPGS